METQDEAATVENHNNNNDNDGNRTVLTAWIMTFRDDLEQFPLFKVFNVLFLLTQTLVVLGMDMLCRCGPVYFHSNQRKEQKQ